MLDSSVLAESGIISGSDYNFGNYDQCVKIHVPEYNLYGKHCMANLQFAPRYYKDTSDESLLYTSPGPLSSVWEKVKVLTISCFIYYFCCMNDLLIQFKEK